MKGLGKIINDLDKRRVVVITDNDIKSLPFIADTVDLLKSEGIEVSLFSDVGSNPTVEMVDNAAAFMKEEKPDAIVCIGGGSSIDTGKAANVIYTHGGSAADYNVLAGGMEKITPKLLPLIAAPTTAGTGSEVTFVSVVGNTGDHAKFFIVSPHMLPDFALLDPMLTVTLPPKMTAYTGLDALTHAIEGYVSEGATTHGDALVLHAIRVIGRALTIAVKRGDDLQAREDMLVASAMAGTGAFINGLGICHAMSHPLSAVFGFAHGLANSMMLQKSMEFNLATNPGRFADIALALGANINGLSAEEAASKSVEAVGKLIEDLGVPRYLDDIGAVKDKIPELVESALRDDALRNNPRKASREEIEAIYRASFR